MIRRIKTWAVGFAASVLLMACGGGGGDPGDCAMCPPGGGDAAVADLVFSLSSQSITNGGGDTVTATVTALNGARNTLSGVDVAISVDSNAVANVSGTTTDGTGNVTATVGVGSDKSNRTVTITAKSGSVTRQASFQVTGTHVTSTYANNVEPGSTGNLIRYVVADISDQPLAGVEISVSAPGLETVTGTTSASGAFEYTYTAPNESGSLEVTATVAGVADIATIQVQETATVPPADGPVGSASVSANPKTVPVNTAGSTANRSQIRALFVGADNKPIQNVRVRFDLGGDPNNIGGTFSSGHDTLYSSANGTVTVSYIPGTRSSPTDGVTIRACYKTTDFANGTECPASATTKLTVTAEAISVTLGTNGEIVVKDLTYVKQFVVQVVDSAGNAMPGVTISPLLDLTAYAKGDSAIVNGVWDQQETIGCYNEDTNRNGVLDPGEDIDHDSVLEPRKADVSVRMVGSPVTDESGLAVLQIEYPQNVAGWDHFKLTVSASGVSGTEGMASYSAWLWIDADAANNTDSDPAWEHSPYGSVASCTDPN